MEKFVDELSGRISFYDKFNLSNDVEYVKNTDGVFKNCVLFEFKLIINNPNGVLSQAIKYLSKMRNSGRLLPEKIIGVDLNANNAYIWDSIDYLNEIETQYIGASSKNNNNFISKNDASVINYSDRNGFIQLNNIIENAVNNKLYTKYHVDITNIIALSKIYYDVNPNKDDFLDGDNAEIRNPKVLNDRIIPYTHSNNLEFTGIMDCLNTKVLQAKLGAFYTPEYCCSESQRLLLHTIKEIQSQGLDYIVIDRCAGTGNLYDGLPDEILDKCILSTLEANEYVVLQEKFSTKATIVVPPTNALDYDIIPVEHDGNGKVVSDYIRDKVNDPNCSIILYENPPYGEAAGMVLHKNDTNKVKMSWKNSFVSTEMKKEFSGVVSNDLSNLFIWSAFKYYLTKPFCYYIVYSPIKYWKQQNLVKKKCIDSFICNRKDFHASEGAIVCSLWKNENANNQTISSRIINTDKVFNIKKVSNLLSLAYDKRKFDNDINIDLTCGYNGDLSNKAKSSIRSIYNKNMIGYLKSESFTLDGVTSSLTRLSLYNGHGFHLRNDNFILKLPLFVASQYYEYLEWFEKGTLCKSYDGLEAYQNDVEFLKSCLIYTCLSNRNKCKSLILPDGTYLKNELCFDYNTLSSSKLLEFNLNSEENILIELNKLILSKIKLCKEYDTNFTYGIFQIQDEINIKEDETNSITKKVIKIYKYPDLNGYLTTLKTLLKTYFINQIKEKLTKYELIK